MAPGHAHTFKLIATSALSRGRCAEFSDEGTYQVAEPTRAVDVTVAGDERAEQESIQKHQPVANTHGSDQWYKH